jgi:hypothetical protein
MLRCEECGKETTSEVEAHHWRAYLTVADEDEPEGSSFCAPTVLSVSSTATTVKTAGIPQTL